MRFSNIQSALLEAQVPHEAWRKYNGYMQAWAVIYKRFTMAGVTPTAWEWKPAKGMIAFDLDLSDYPELGSGQDVVKLVEQASFFSKAKQAVQGLGNTITAKAREFQVNQVKGALDATKQMLQKMKRDGYLVEVKQLETGNPMKLNIALRPGDKDWEIIGQHKDFQVGKDINDPEQRSRASAKDLLHALESGTMKLDKLTKPEIASVFRSLPSFAKLTPGEIQRGNQDFDWMRSFIAKAIVAKAKPDEITLWAKNNWLSEEDMRVVSPKILVDIIEKNGGEPEDYDPGNLAKQAMDLIQSGGTSTNPSSIAKMTVDQVIDAINKKPTLATLNTLSQHVMGDVAQGVFSSANIPKRKKWGYDLAGWAAQRLVNGTMKPEDAYEDELLFAWGLWKRLVRGNEAKLGGQLANSRLDYLQGRITELQKNFSAISKGKPTSASQPQTSSPADFHAALQAALEANADDEYPISAALLELKGDKTHRELAGKLYKLIEGNNKPLSDAMKQVGTFPRLYVKKIKVWEAQGAKPGEFGKISI